MKNREIERKFLVNGDFKSNQIKKFRIKQGYISTDPSRTVRIRLVDNEAYITIKGIGNKTGVTRFEWENKIPVSDAEELMLLCKGSVIDKIRYLINENGFVYEVDEFISPNKGMVLAELELESEDQKFYKPIWLGEEVTGIKEYYNSSISGIE